MEIKGEAKYALVEVKYGGMQTSSYRTLDELIGEVLSSNGEEFVKKVRDEIIPRIVTEYESDDLDEGMARFTFSSLSENDATYYDDLYRDFHPCVNNIVFDDEGTFTVEASADFLERVFYQLASDGSGLCQNYTLVK